MGGIEMKSKWTTVVVLVLAFSLVAAACGGDGDGGEFNLISADTLTICTDAPYPPMEFEKDGVFTGFDIELMRAIADSLDLDLVVNNIGFDAITSGIAMESSECDLAAASITITAEREENIDFSDAYFTAVQSLLAKKDSGHGTLSDFDGLNLGVQSGTTGELYAQENATGATLVSFENPGDLFTALEAGEIEGILQDIVPNAAQALDDDTVAVIETYPAEPEDYGLAVQEEGKEALLEAVNEALSTFKSDGTYDSLYTEWFPGG